MRIDLNIKDGFFSKFDENFVSTFENYPNFVRTLSDFFTKKAELILNSLSSTNKSTSCAILGTRECFDLLMELFSKVPGAEEVALHEAFGQLPIGTLNDLVDMTLGIGTFYSFLEENRTVIS